MKMIRMALFAGLLASAFSYAQTGGPPPRRTFGARGAFAGPMEHGFGGHAGRVVTGAAYSATATSQTTQTLADGNTISHSNSSKIARDDAGRTFEQQTISAGPLAQNGPVTFTFITDPVAGYSYVLNGNAKTATRRALPKPRSGFAPPPGDGGPERRPRAFDAVDRTESDLGSQTVNGVTAQGKKITRTVPAGAMGNAQPIVSTSETWYSPDLQVIVLSTREDPRQGKSTYSLTNIQRGAPDPSTFQIPADYTVQDAPVRSNFRGVPHPPAHN